MSDEGKLLPAFEPGRIITALRALARDPTRIAVRVDRRRVAVVGRQAGAALGLAVGTPWTEALAARVADAAMYDKAKRYAIRSLGVRARSRASLVERIVRRGHERPIAERVGADLERAGVIDDRAYARSFVEAELRQKGVGRRLLEMKLRQRRIDAALAREVLGEFFAERDAVQDALALARKRAKAGTRLEPVVLRRRLFAWLARRGFDPDTCRQAVERVMRERGGAEDEGGLD